MGLSFLRGQVGHVLGRGPTAVETILSFLSKDAPREAVSPVLLENSSPLSVHPLCTLQRQHISALLSWAVSEPNAGIEPDAPPEASVQCHWLLTTIL